MKNSEQKISDSFSHHYILWHVCKNYATAIDSVCTWLLTFHFSRSPSFHHHLPSYPFCLLQLWTVNYKYCYNHSAESQDMHKLLLLLLLLLRNNKHKPWKSADYTSYLQWTPSTMSSLHTEQGEREKWWECREGTYSGNGSLSHKWRTYSFLSGCECRYVNHMIHFVQPRLTRSDVWLTVHRNSAWIRKTN